jgi:hypothetical protein
MALSDGLSVTGITGDVQSLDVEASPVSASTEAIASGGTGTVTASISAAEDASGELRANVTATSPLDGVRDDANTTLSVETVPTDPVERATRIAGVEGPAELDQNDVTITITRFARGLDANGVDITQNDVTTLITLFERN